MAKKAFELDQQVYQRDLGSIVLYRRPDHKSPRWNCRVSVNGVSNEYFRKSSRTTDQDQALRFAEDQLRLLYVKSQQTGSIRSKSFKKVVSEYLREMKHSNKSESAISEYRERLQNYAVEYFGNKSIDLISSSDMADFVQWRREHGIRKKPTDTTIAKELALLKQVFSYSYRKRYISEKMEFPRLNGKGKIRPHFTRIEYARLTRNLREWVKDSKTRHPRTYRERFYLQQYVLILANCGCRIGEMRKLRWNDIQHIRYEGNDKGVCFWVSGKTGKRQVIPQQVVTRYLDKLRKFRTSELTRDPPLDECVFCHSDGSCIGSFRKGFNALLEQYGLLTDIEENRHTLYSLRHTYAVFRISEEVNHYLLATNMGTGVDMLQKHYLKLTTVEHARELTKTRTKISEKS